ncbi:hypothetical protein GJAV_G00054980 [Gymnothorax javanicus]|nr:hypothetical protein GJAV_G00054980 [Gymnothorax javanicus]
MAHVRFPEKRPVDVATNLSSVLGQPLCVNGTQWIFYLLEECVENVWEYSSVVIGLISMFCFLLSTLPQVYEAYRNGKVEEAMSMGFLLFLLSGDLTNFTGCYLTNQLPIQIVTAVFYIFTDVILVSQFMYYKIRNGYARKKPFLKWICFLWCGASTVGCLVLPKLIEDGKVVTVGQNSSNKVAISGYVCGYLASIFYLSSRFPQLYKNYQRQSTEGTSYWLFALAMLGNGTYGLSLIVVLPALKGSKGLFILRHLAWLIGSLGVLFLDFIITAQFVLYRKRRPSLPVRFSMKKVPEVEPLLYTNCIATVCFIFLLLLLKITEAVAVKYQQHQESLSAQLQVVYEHRSRLEKSLQKERLEQKKSKEDLLVYKLEAQQILNKEKQDSSNKFNSLHVQHQMLKNQHEDLKKQFFSLQDQHQVLKEEHSKVHDEHRQKYDQLQQDNELQISKLRETVYNLQEENRQLRKAHQNVHVQLQDVRQQHKDLKLSHDRLALTVQDHKSALASAQLQIEKYKQLKETLNRMPGLPQSSAPPTARSAALRLDISQKQPTHVEPLPQLTVPRAEDGPGHRPDLGGEHHPPLAAFQHAAQPVIRVSQGAGSKPGEEVGRRPDEEQHGELVGQRQHQEESKQPREEGQAAKHDLLDDNAVLRDFRLDVQHPGQRPQPYVAQQLPAPAERVKSALAQQQEQQRLEAQVAEERRRLHLRQEALQRQRLQALAERERQLRLEREREMEQHREASRKEQLLREQQQRQRIHYENMDAGLVQGAEDWKREPVMRRLKIGDEERQEVGGGIHPEGPLHNVPEKDLNPEDDPNNQGEDEFEEAQAQRGEAGPPAVHSEHHLQQNPNRPLVLNGDGRQARGAFELAGNPDQQEDMLDEQYQEEGEEEAQDDLLAGQKRDEEVFRQDHPINNDNRVHVLQANVKQHNDLQPQPRDVRNVDTANEEEENYEEEDEEELVDEEEEGALNRPPNRRGEM